MNHIIPNGECWAKMDRSQIDHIENKQKDYTQKPAKYAKNMILVHIPNNSPSRWKNRGQRLAEALKGRWTHRERGYIMSKRKADRFRQLYDEGWDATFITCELVPPKNEEGNQQCQSRLHQI